jgi:hypothetical protein
MTLKQLCSVPFKAGWNDEVKCSSLIVIPGGGKKKELHDSGYRTMSFVATDENDMPITQLSGCSDVISLDGIGGYGYRWLEKHGTVPKLVDVAGWAIDCLPVSGCLRLFCSGRDILCGASLSTFEIYAVAREKKKGVANE